MSYCPQVIKTNDEFFSCYHTLRAGDIVTCRLRLKYGEEHILLDLQERGIHLIPSATSQLASRSKCFQARLLAPLMIPQTVVIYDVNELLETISFYGEHEIGKVVVKHDRKNAGLGIFLFQSIEEVYTQAANNVLSFPFVLQPFVTDSRDIRVILIDDFIEAYERNNPHGFRNNLHCGGSSTPVQLDEKQIQLCKNSMTRAGYPFAHLDLMTTKDGKTYLAEINLRGGMKGATVDKKSYHAKIAAVQAQLLENFVSKKKGAVP